MGFLSGSVTFQKFHVTNDPTDAFGAEHLEKLQQFRIGAFETNLYEKPNVGFTAGGHLFDTDFELEKNLIGDALHFGIRVDSCQIPGPIKKAWMKQELAPLMVDNPGARPSKAVRDEAKEAVEARCADEADQGNFKKMNETSILWDSGSESIYIGSTSEKNNELCLGLLEQAFEIELAQHTPTTAMESFAHENGLVAQLHEAQPTAFIPELGIPPMVWWNGESENYDYVGNEFLLWLWWNFEIQSGSIQLPDESVIDGFFARSLNLDCPFGESGKESISSDSPVTLPEASLAIKMGKLPRKAGLTLASDGMQYDFSIQAESLSIGSAKIKELSESAEPPTDEERIEWLRSLSETIDGLFTEFCGRRLGGKWDAEVKKMTKWLLSDTPNVARKRAA